MIKKHCIGIFKTLGSAVRWFCIIHCVGEYGGQIVWCNGPSMEPTIFNDDILFVRHVTPSKESLKKGDIIIAKSPTDPQNLICKRIAALEDEEICRDYTTNIVPKGHVWLEGDNSDNSNDSRSYGPVPLGLVKGRAVLKVYPFNDKVLLTSINDPNQRH